jgi:hypothetical protein
MPRVQHEALVKLLAADFSDDATILASLSDLRAGIADARARLDILIERAEQLPHRTRYLRLVNDYGSRSLDTLSEWLQLVEGELGRTARQGPSRVMPTRGSSPQPADGLAGRPAP